MRKVLAILALAMLLIAPVYGVAGTANAATVFKICDPSNFSEDPDAQATAQKAQRTAACQDQKNQKGNPIIKIIKVALEVVSWVAGIAATILIIVSAVKFMTSGGDSAAVASARTTLINAVIGMVVIFVSQGIIALITGSL
jgi:hypothetical protein